MNTIEIIEINKQKTYSIGQMFLYEKRVLYCLACCNRNEILLISVKDGRRFGNSIIVKNMYQIDTQELDKFMYHTNSIFDEKFTPIDVEIKVTI